MAKSKVVLVIDLDGIAHVIRFLISDDARVINGACINLAYKAT